MGSNSACATSFTPYDTGDTSELLTTLPGDLVKRVVYSKDVGTLGVNDILLVSGEVEMTNDSGVPAGFGAQLILGSSASATSGTELDEGNTFNITPGMHHGTRVKGSIKNFSTGSSKTFVNFVVWTNQTLTVEQDNGRLQILRITP